MKMGLEWHRKNWKNSHDSLIRSKEELKALHNRICADEARVEFRGYQIQQAEKEGKDSFDEERYKVKRGAK